MPNLTKAQVKAITALQLKKERDTMGQFIAEGTKMVDDLLSNNIQAANIYCTQESKYAQHAQAIIVQDFELEKLSAHKSTPDVVAIFQKPQNSKKIEGLCLYLHDVQDPGNVGTIIRTADWFGIKAIFMSAQCADAFGAKTIQASMGSIARVSILQCSLETALQKMPNDTKVYAADMEGENIKTTIPNQNALLIMGSEGRGLSNLELPDDTIKVTIPRIGKAESLNVATAAAIIMSTWR
jgi:RNA methyltransferase, TrmH family